MEIKSHKHIVVSGDTGNALGVIRSIAEGGIAPILIYLMDESRLPCLIKSKWLTVVHKVHSYEEAIDLLIAEYGNEEQLPFVYTCDDSVESIVDNRYDAVAEEGGGFAHHFLLALFLVGGLFKLGKIDL